MKPVCHCCEEMADHLEGDDGLIAYDERFGDYAVRMGSALVQPIAFCPWCGGELPVSQRDEWFDAIEAMGLDPRADQIPDAYASGVWRTRH